MSHNMMDVDQSGTGEGGGLKRSNSAPMLNVLGKDDIPQGAVGERRCHEAPGSVCATGHTDATAKHADAPHHAPPGSAIPLSLALHSMDDCKGTGSLPTTPTQAAPLVHHRIRRFSCGPGTVPQATPRIPAPRLNQLRDEECGLVSKETQRERDIQTALVMSRSWDHLHVSEQPDSVCGEGMVGGGEYYRRPRSFSDALHVYTNLPNPTPSPTRPALKQHFSPSMQAPVSVSAHVPSPNPSPTRSHFRRSVSPIAVAVPRKRKLECESSILSPAKRFQLMGGGDCPPHPLAHSTPPSGEGLLRGPAHPHRPVSAGACFTFTPLGDTSNSTNNSVLTHNTSDSDVSDMTDHSDSSSVSFRHGLLGLHHHLDDSHMSSAGAGTFQPILKPPQGCSPGMSHFPPLSTNFGGGHPPSHSTSFGGGNGGSHISSAASSFTATVVSSSSSSQAVSSVVNPFSIPHASRSFVTGATPPSGNNGSLFVFSGSTGGDGERNREESAMQAD